MGSITLLGSIFLPAAVMQPFADALTARGHEVSVAAPNETVPTDTDSVDADSITDSVDADSIDAVIDAYAAGIRPGSVLIAHSNAGNFVPALARRTSASAVVFVDAVLPPFEGGTWSVVPPDAADRIRPSAHDGVLPRWTRWWPRDDAVALFPTLESFEQIDTAARGIRASYLDLTASAAPGWSSAVPAAYLALSDAYAAHLRRAGSRGWPTAMLDCGHLGILRDPDAVATATLALLARL